MDYEHLNEEELDKYKDEYGEETFTTGIGAEAVLEMLKNWCLFSNSVHPVE